MLAALAACGGSETAPPPTAQELLGQDWSAIEAQARGQTVTWGIWQGDPFINDYVSKYLVPELAQRYGITLRPLSSQGEGMVSSSSPRTRARQRKSAS